MLQKILMIEPCNIDLWINIWLSCFTWYQNNEIKKVIYDVKKLRSLLHFVWIAIMKKEAVNYKKEGEEGKRKKKKKEDWACMSSRSSNMKELGLLIGECVGT